MKNQAAQKKIPNEVDKLLSWAHKNYVVGNFYQARKMVNTILHDTGISSGQKTDAANIIRLTSIDKLALGTGLLSLIFTIIVAMVVGYK